MLVSDLVWICRLSLFTEHFREVQGRLQGAVGELGLLTICMNDFYFCLFVGGPVGVEGEGFFLRIDSGPPV